MMEQSRPVLEAQAIDMRFGGVKALDGVDVALPEGVWTGLIGPNGSGKTTLLNVLSGIYRPTAGTVRLSGVDVTRMGPRGIGRRGLVRTFQHPQLAESLSIRDNVMLGVDLSRRSGGSATEADVEEALVRFHCAGFADHLPASAPYGIRKMAEIARAVVAGPAVLLLDEPAAGLSREERVELVAALRDLREAHPGLAVCLVEHDVRMVASLCERIQALNFGKVLAVGDAADVLKDSRVREAYLGRAQMEARP